jgi:ribonuclease D
LVLGFDTEWRVMFRKGEAPRPTALVQLCTEDECFLFQVSQHAVTPTLRTLLESPRVVKAGVGVFADVAKLRSDYGVEMQGVMNLAQLAAMKLGGEETWNLSSLTERVLRRSLAKDPRVRLGNWERVPLNVAQVQYACCDAYAGLLIFQKLRSWNEDEERLLYAEERRAIAMRQEEKESLAVLADGESGRGRGQGRGRGRERGRGQVQVRAGGPPLPAAQRIVPIEVRDG